VALHLDIYRVGIATNEQHMVVIPELDVDGVGSTAHIADGGKELDGEQLEDAPSSILASSSNSKFMIVFH